MKKFFRSIAIVALALASVGTVTSCGSDDDSKEPKDVLVPIDQVQGKIEYEYSSETLELFDIKYEVTDFEGKKETVAVTEPGKGEKIYTAKKISDVAYVKLIVTAKDVKKVGTGNTFKLKFFSRISLPIHVGGITIDAAEGYLPDLFTVFKGYSNDVEQSEEYIKAIQELYVGTSEIKVALPQELYNGVSQEWINKQKK